MRVDARGLRRHVGAHAHHATGKLIGEFESLQIEIVAGAVSSDSRYSMKGGMISS